VTDTDEPILESIRLSNSWTPSAGYCDRLERARKLSPKPPGNSTCRPNTRQATPFTAAVSH
jgi:hypothetical protein